MANSVKVFALALTQGFNAIVGFFFLPYLVRALSPQEYGTYGQVLLVTDTARVLFTMGMTTILYVTLSRSPDAKEQESDFKAGFYSLGILGAAACALVLASAGFFAGVFDSPSIEGPLRIHSLNLMLSLPYSLLYALLIFLGDFRRSMAIFSLTLLLRVATVVIAVEYFQTVEAIFWALVGVSAVQLALGLWAVPRRFLAGGRFEPARALRQVSLGLSLGLTELLGFGIAYTDKYSVSALLSVEDFAVYRNGAFELPVIGTLYTSIAAIYLPVVSGMLAARKLDEIAALKRRIITATSAVLWPIVGYLIVFSLPLVTIYFSRKYVASSTVFAILSLVLFLRVNDYMDILVSAGKGRLLVFLYALAFVVNVPLSLVLVGKFGYHGAAIGNVATQALLLAVLFHFSAREIGKSWRDLLDLRKLALVLAVSLSLPAALHALDLHSRHPSLLLLAGAVSVTAAYLVFLKLGVIAYGDLSPLVRRVPLLGARIDRLGAGFFPEKRH